MSKSNPATVAGVSGGQRLYLKQMLNDVIDQLNKQLTGIEQTIALAIPGLAEGLNSTANMRELETVLSELLQCDDREQVLADTLASASALSWQEERAWAQARERVLEQAVANLLQAVWLGTALKRQAVLTEGLTCAQRMISARRGKTSENN
ncbi:MAG: hypothetical protein GX952_03195 [Firmicutes bacterium]|nr:hypothetical protein [Bacillota bacterium]